MKRHLHAYLSDIVDSIDAIADYTLGMTEERFSGDRQVQDAVVRRLQIIGDAVKAVPIAVRARYPTIPWASIAGMRDRLVHAYFGVRMPLVWLAVQRDLKPLREVVERILAEPPEV